MIARPRSWWLRVPRPLSRDRNWQRYTSTPFQAQPPATAGAWCMVCRWHGDRFVGGEHCEGAACPRCGSIARDRFLLASFTSTHVITPGGADLRVLETSPRMGAAYRTAMARWFEYTSSDHDQRAHNAEIQLDLQRIALPADSFDAVLSSHVMEHVPDPRAAFAELHRIIAPGGALYLQVPFLQGTTSVPSTPEFHGDDTLVHWRFGWDLIDLIETAGFRVTPLVPATFPGPGEDPGALSPEFDVGSLVEAAPHDRLQRVGDRALADVSGWRPGYMFVTLAATVDR